MSWGWGGEIGVRLIKWLLDICISYTKVQDQWRTELIHPIWKRKGNVQNPGRYRAISLLGHIMLCHVMLCQVMLCHVMLCHVMLCHVMLCHVMLCHVMLCHVMLCHVMLCHVMLCHIMLCHVMLCHVMLCHVMKLLHKILDVWN